jgi:CRISPR-associated endonuclease Cas2
MARPRKKVYSLSEKLALLKAKGISEAKPIPEEDLLPELNERIAQILQLLKTSPIKSTEMIYLIMYDISDNKVRIQIAKYLLKAGCIRIQKSVFLLRSENARFQEIHDTLKEVNSYYENKDSIILVPVNASDVRSMKLIGKNVNIVALTDKPNTLFF